jgi:hypothetical protein
MNRWCLGTALALCALLLLAHQPPAHANHGDSNAQSAQAFLTASFAATRDALSARSTPNGQTAYLLAFYAQHYASLAAKNNDRDAARIAYTFGLTAAQYSYNAYLMTGDVNSLNGYVYGYLGALFAQSEASR